MSRLQLTRPAQQVREYVASVKAIFFSLRSRLGFKLVAVVAGGVLIGTVLSSTLILYQQQQQLINSARASARHDSTVIQASLEHAMLTGDPAMLNQMMQAVASGAGLRHIWILDLTGRVRFSSTPGEAGQSFAQGDPPCQGCHSVGANGSQLAALADSKIAGESLLNVNMISNQAECHACHDPAARSLGLLLVDTPLTDLNAQLSSSFWKVVLATLFTFALIVGLLTPALGQFVIRPIVKLVRSVNEIGSGNLDTQSPVQGDDELGKLGAAFEAMRLQLKAALFEKEQRNRELRMLNEIAFATSQVLDPQQILDLTINIAVDSLGVEAGSIHLLDRDHDRFLLHACQGISQCHGIACDARAFSQALAGITRPESPVVSLPIASADGACRLSQDPAGRSYVGVSLKAQGVLMGAMTLITRPGQTVTEAGTQTLRTMGEEIGQALANALHFQNVRYQATAEEHKRLAQEMHDALAQALGYLKLKAAITDELLSDGHITEAQANLREVKDLAGKTYFDVRETIFGLRNTTPSEAGFLPALTEYLAKYRTYYGLNAQLILDDGISPTFTAEASTQLTRIIQEALTNVRKHAQTTQARVHIERIDHHWQIAVEDDGLGFDVSQVAQPGPAFFGMQIMRERAESIGARLDVDSQPGGGTRVIIQLPMARED